MSHLGTTTRMSMATATATTTTLLSSPFPQRRLSSPAAYRKFSKRQFSTDRLRNSSTVKSSPDNKDPEISRFLDEQGVVGDMDGYLNHLSLEYDSVWDTKPSWCQPWTITLTGVLVTAASWQFLHSAPLTIIVLFLVSAWWYIFLYSYPKAYTDMIAERRKKVSKGMEDTFGL